MAQIPSKLPTVVERPHGRRRGLARAAGAAGILVIGISAVDLVQLCMSWSADRKLEELHGLLLRGTAPQVRSAERGSSSIRLSADAVSRDRPSAKRGRTDAENGAVATDIEIPARKRPGSRLWLSWIVDGVVHPRLDVSDAPEGTRMAVSLAAPPAPGAPLAILEIDADELTTWPSGHPATASGSLLLAHLREFRLHPIGRGDDE